MGSRRKLTASGGSGNQRPRFAPYSDFIETPFSRRFQRVLMDMREARTGCVVSAPSSNGKTWSVADLVRASHPYKSRGGETRLSVLAACAPHDNGRATAMGESICASFGVIPHMSAERQKAWLVAQLLRAQVELLIVDDAHFLTIPHLLFLRELIDRLSLPPYEYRIGLCMVAAADKEENTLITTLQRREQAWVQYRNRLDYDRPFVMIDGHSEQEVCDIVAVLENHYRAQLPDLRLVRWSHAIYEYLTHPLLDPTGTKRVTIGNLTNFIRSVASSAYTQGLTDVTGKLLAESADWITYHKTKILHINDESEPTATS